MRYFIQKFIQLVIVVFAVTFTVSLALAAIPNAKEKVLAAKGSGAIDIVEQNKILDSVHLRDPLVKQYGYFLKDLVTLDWGTTFGGNQSVRQSVGDGLAISLRLMIYAQIMALVLAIPISVLAAYRAGGVFDRLSTTTSFGFLALPNYVLATVLALLLTVRWKIFPALSKDVSFFDSPFNHFKNFFLPTVVIAMPLAATYIRLLRSDLIGTLQSDFITTARAKGLSTARILFGHALRPSMFSLLTAAAVNVGALVGGSIVVENAFNLNGLGRRTVVGIFANEFRLVQITVVLLALVYVVANFLVDIAYGFLDPRVRVARALA
jgi:peptide/nickel transport system permease protein